MAEPIILDGKALSKKIIEECKQKAEGKDVTLAVVLVGDDPASKVYVGSKEKACERLGINSVIHRLPEETTEKELLDLIDKLNKDAKITGFIVQLPLPKHLEGSKRKVIAAIDPKKDVDGFHPLNLGDVFLTKDNEFLVSATPAGIIRLLDEYNVEYEGKKAVVVGASNIVGKPVSVMLLNRGATVSVCHILTPDISEYTKDADILVVAVGKPDLITADMVKDGVVVVDVGMNRLESGKLVGDVNFEGVSKKASMITPVPGGVGPMTIASLIENTVKAAGFLV